MSRSPLSRSRTVAVAATVLALGVSGLAAGPAAIAAGPRAQASTSYQAGRYIVLLDDAATATYAGGLSGLAATRARPGRRFDAGSKAATAYRGYLAKRQARLADRYGVTRLYSYTVANNGFAATLSGRQASQLARSSGVRAVVKDRLAKPDTTESPRFLGLSGAGGVWRGLGGVDAAGKGVVVGVVDSGYWPENPSFAGAPLPKATSVSAAAPGPVVLSDRRDTAFYKSDGKVFHGLCQPGEQFPATTCNTKVISARYFDDGFSSAVKKSGWTRSEYKSPRDGAGHGSHTASTAAGNNGVPVTIEGRDFGTASGMAPAAKIAVYKVCWEAIDPAQAGCYNSDTVAGIDAAVADGVDVINYSISGTLTNPIDPVEVGFLSAAAAGIFVAASAGNSGPKPSTVAHPSPWLTTVAASTHFPREGTVVLPNGDQIKGASVTVVNDVTGILALSDESAAATGAAAVEAARLCGPGSLNPAAVTGKIVNCDRGGYDRVAKSAEVKRVGGIGMVLTNTTPNSLDADFHSVPTVHVSHVYRPQVRAAKGQSVTLKNGNLTGTPTPVPQIAAFSSRGPSLAAGGDLLKPDISAPGVSVVAAVAPPSNSGRLWDLYSGTSMSSPHIAGLAALFFSKGQSPKWSPMAVKSAMMTTAYDLVDDTGAAVQDPFAQGAGHVNPAKFFDPGIVFDAKLADWFGYLAGQGVTRADGSQLATPIDASDLNLPSLAIGDLAGVQQVTRRITNVSGSTETYSVAYSGDTSITVTPDQATYTVAAGATATVRLTVQTAATGADFGQYATGFLTFTSTGHKARIPVAVRPLEVKADAEVAAPAGAAATVTINGVSGFQGTLNTAVTGLTAATPVADTVAVGGFDDAAPAATASAKEFTLEVGADTDLARFDVNATNDADDLDLYVYRVSGSTSTLVGVSATGSADEQVTLVKPAAGTYRAYVVGFASSTGSTSAFVWTQWAVPTAPVVPANLTLEPSSLAVTVGQAFTLTGNAAGLDATKRYLGRVHYLNGAVDTGVATVVTVG